MKNSNIRMSVATIIIKCLLKSIFVCSVKFEKSFCLVNMLLVLSKNRIHFILVQIINVPCLSCCYICEYYFIKEGKCVKIEYG